MDFLNEILDKYFFVSPDINNDEMLSKETTFYLSTLRLPDGTEIKISKEKFEIPEILFDQALLPETIYNVITLVLEKFFLSVVSILYLELNKD